MKYFRIFNNHSDYEDFRGSDDYPTYNISLCLEEGDVHLSEEKKADYSEKYFTIESLEDNNEIIINSFYYLFDACNGIISAENLVLPSLVVNGYGYGGMFDKCSNLVKAPKLPATKLEGNSCRSM